MALKCSRGMNVLRFTRASLSHLQTRLTYPLARCRNIAYQTRDAEYAFYDLSLQQPTDHDPSFTPFVAPAKEAGLHEDIVQANMASRMDENSGRTTGLGGPRASPVGKIIFGSRLAGPAARPPPAPETVRIVEGIEVPPKPEEPDNCCMSGCVHCVWDIYREDIEYWQATRKRARDALKGKKKRVPRWLGGKAAQMEEMNPLGDIDPGLRAFMELEKNLQEKRLAREQHQTAA